MEFTILQTQLNSLLLFQNRVENGARLVTVQKKQFTNVDASYLNKSDYAILVSHETSLSQKMDAFSLLQTQARVEDQSKFQLEIVSKNDCNYMNFSIGGKQIVEQEIKDIINEITTPEQTPLLKKYKSGKMLMEGRLGVQQDVALAYPYLEEAEKNGSSEAQEELSKYGRSSENSYSKREPGNEIEQNSLTSYEYIESSIPLELYTSFEKRSTTLLDPEEVEFSNFLHEIINLAQRNETDPVEELGTKLKKFENNNKWLQKFRQLYLYSYFLQKSFTIRLLQCFEHKDDTNLVKHIEVVLRNAGDLSRYPEAETCLHVNSHQSLSEKTRQNIMRGPLAYTFFTDRVLADQEKFPDKNYGPVMFNDPFECSGDYILAAFKAVSFLYEAELSFSSNSNAKKLFDILEETNRLALGEPNCVLNKSASGMGGTDGHIWLFYDCTKIDDPQIGYRYYAAHELLNSNARLHGDMAFQSNAQKAMMLSTRYQDKTDIVECFSKHLNEYQTMLKSARTEEEQITAIIIFISVLEASHYFENGNNRLFCQMLFNKLLIENGLSQSILYIPNGFSRYVLGILPWQVRLGILPLKEVSLNVLTAHLLPALIMVREGQKFFAHANGFVS